MAFCEFRHTHTFQFLIQATFQDASLYLLHHQEVSYLWYGGLHSCQQRHVPLAPAALLLHEQVCMYPLHLRVWTHAHILGLWNNILPRARGHISSLVPHKIWKREQGHHPSCPVQAGGDAGVRDAGSVFPPCVLSYKDITHLFPPNLYLEQGPITVRWTEIYKA